MEIKSVLLMLLISTAAVGEQTPDMPLSLKECIIMGYANNLKLKQIQTEIIKSQYQLKEIIGAGLPQISSFASFEDYLNVPTTMVSGEILGQPGIMVPIQLGTKYNAVAGIQAGQMIYDASFFASVRLFRKITEINYLNAEQAREELAYAIARMYLFIRISDRQLVLADSSLDTFKKIYNVSEQHFRNGLIRKTDLDRVTVTINNLATERDNLLAARNQQLNMLKYMIGIEQYRGIALTDDLEQISFSDESIDTTLRQLTMMKLLEQQKELAGLNKTLANAARMPSVSGFALFNYQGQMEDLGDINNDNNWYKTSYVGLKVSIQLFKGNSIINKINQHKIEINQAETGIEDLRNEISVKLISALERLRMSRESESRSEFSREMAAGVLKVTSQQYSQGIKPLTEVFIAQSEYNNAYISWLNSFMQIKLSELEIAKLNGSINTVFQ